MATIEFIEQNNILEKVKEDEQWMYKALNILKSKHPIIEQVRGIGLLWALELKLNGKPATNEAEHAMYACLAEGLSFKVSQGNVIQLSPALTVEKQELSQACTILDTSLDSIK